MVTGMAAIGVSVRGDLTISPGDVGFRLVVEGGAIASKLL